MAKQGIILGAAIAAAVVLIGGGMYWSSQQPRRFVFDVELYSLDPTRRPETKVFVNGVETPLGHLPDVEAPVVTAEGGLAKEFSPDVVPRIEVQYRYACGWKPVHLALQQPRDDEIKAARSGGRNIRMHAEVNEDGWVHLYTDNRGEPAHRVELGGIAADIAKDSSNTLTLLQDTRCAAGSEITLDGKSIGALPGTAPGRSATTAQFLFDTSGKRCYTYRQVSYVSDRLPDTTLDPDVTPKVFDLLPGYFHALPDDAVNYFLEEPPDEVLVPENQLVPGLSYVQASLVERPCPGKRRAR